MPIIVDSEIHVLTEREFLEQAEKVIGIVFDVHNQFGRLVEIKCVKPNTGRPENCPENNLIKLFAISVFGTIFALLR